ncbi:hypothetical protein K439DRAFT_1507584 [Ramaria rubella]|nr:hypothetical protein K439DRAFT_1507584 [Ramaria rubella]
MTSPNPSSSPFELPKDLDQMQDAALLNNPSGSSADSGSASVSTALALFDSCSPVAETSTHSIVRWAAPLLQKHQRFLIEKAKIAFTAETSLQYMRMQIETKGTMTFLAYLKCPTTNEGELQEQWNDLHKEYISSLQNALERNKVDNLRRCQEIIKPDGLVSLTFYKELKAALHIEQAKNPQHAEQSQKEANAVITHWIDQFPKLIQKGKVKSEEFWNSEERKKQYNETKELEKANKSKVQTGKEKRENTSIHKARHQPYKVPAKKDPKGKGKAKE